MKKLFVFMLLLLSASFLYADIINLKNGRSISGEIIAETNEVVTVKNVSGEGFETISSFNRSDIQNIEKGVFRETYVAPERKEVKEQEPKSWFQKIIKKKEISQAKNIEVFPYQVHGIFSSVYNSGLGKIEGYIVFVNENGDQCSTKGKVSIFQTRRVAMDAHELRGLGKYGGETAHGQRDVLKEFVFSPEDFKIIRDGSKEVFGLPFILPPGSVETKDKIEIVFGGLTCNTKVQYNRKALNIL